MPADLTKTMSLDELAEDFSSGDHKAMELAGYELLRRLRAGIAACEAVMGQRGANNAVVNRRIVARDIHEKLTATTEPASEKPRICPGCWEPEGARLLTAEPLLLDASEQAGPRPLRSKGES